MNYGRLEDDLVRTRKANEKLESEKVLHCDEIHALRAAVRSYQDELARMTISCQDGLARTRISHEDELAPMRENIQLREGKLVSEKICALEVEKHSYLDEIENLRAERLRQDEEVRSLETKASFCQDDLGKARKEIARLQADILSQKEEIRALQVEKLQNAPATIIGKEVRLRYLEGHRQRMGRRIGELGHDRKKKGDRAAHRGRPVVDAWLCLTGEIKDRDVYPDLYGVMPELMMQWKDVSKIVEVTGFRASLQSEGRLTAEFRNPFQSLLEIAKRYRSPTELIAAFEENKVLLQLHGQLQDCYDKIVAANPRCKNPTGASLGSDSSV